VRTLIEAMPTFEDPTLNRNKTNLEKSK